MQFPTTRSLRFEVASLLFGCGLILSVDLYAAQVTQSFRLEGLLTSAETSQPLLDANALLKVQILDPSKTCVLYEEEQSINTASSNGKYSIQVGSAVGSTMRTSLDPAHSMAKIYQNKEAITASNVPGETCSGGTYVPASLDVRYLRVIVTPSSTLVADTLTPDTVIGSVPTALVAESLGKITPEQVLISGTGDLNQSNLQNVFATGNSQKLLDLLSLNLASLLNTSSSGNVGIGTTSPKTRLDVSGGIRVGMEATPCSPNLSGTIRNNLGTPEFCNGSSWGPLGGGGPAIIDGSMVSAALGYTPQAQLGFVPVNKAGDSMSGALNLPSNGLNVGTGQLVVSGGNIGIGTTSPSQALHVIGKAQITPSGTSGILVDSVSDESLTKTRLISNGAIYIQSNSNNAGTAGVTIAKPAGAGTDTTTILKVDSRNQATGTTPVLDVVSASTGLLRVQQNGNVGIGTTTPGDKLHVEGRIRAQEICDSSGGNCRNLSQSWTGGSVTSVAVGGLPLSVSNGSTTPQISIAQANSGAAGYLSAADWAAFNNKQPAGAYLTTISSSNVATALGYTPLSPTLASNQVLVGNGSNLAAPTFFGIGQMRNSLGTLQFPTSCAASQTLTWNAINDVLTCSNIGSLPATAISSGTIDSARLPFGAGLWQDGGSGRVYYNGGNVGIGTTSPTTKLHAYSAGANVIYSQGGGIISQLGADGSTLGNVGTYSNHPFAIITNNSERMRIDTSGNVGIGTTSPSSALEIQVDTNNFGGVVSTNRNSGNLAVSGFGANNDVPGSGITFGLTNSGYSVVPGYANYGFVFTEPAANGLLVATSSTDPIILGTNGTPRIMINGADGNVGIGTTSPGAKLEVAGQVKISGGSPGAGKVLQSDANGLASWAVLGGSESTSVSNIGTAGVGVYKQMTGSAIELKKINAGTGAISITDDTINNEIDINVASGGVGTTQLGDDSVTYEKLQNVSTNNRILGRWTLGAGDAEEITVGSGLLLSGGILTAPGSGGTVTSVSVSGLPLTVSNGTTTPRVGINQANGSQAGFLSAADWNLFNSKQPTGAYLTSIGAAQVETALGYTPVSRAGDTMTGALNLPANGLAVGTNQLVASGGNVGIGTTSPDSKLHVNGAIRATDICDETGSNCKDLSAGWSSSGSSDPIFYKCTNAQTQNAGDLPCSGAAASSGAGNATYRALNCSYGSAYTTTGDALQWTGTKWQWRAYTGAFFDCQNGTVVVMRTDAAGGSYTSQWTAATGGINYAAGNVGIGTTTPGDKLHVEGRIRAQEICDSSGGNCKVISGGWGTGSVTAVGVSGLPLSVTNGSSTPQISIAQANGSQAGFLSSADWASFNNKQPAGAYLTSITGENVTTALGFTPLSAALSANQVMIGNGSNLATAGFFGIGQMRNAAGVAQFPTACAASQTLTWSAVTDVLACSNIGSLPASAITTGTIDSARLPFGAGLWQDGGSGRAYYNGGNVGIGNTSPSRALDVTGKINATLGLQVGSPVPTNTDLLHVYGSSSTGSGSLTFSSNFVAAGVYSTAPATGFAFSGQTSNAAAPAVLSGIMGGKENVVNGNNASFISLHTKPSGGVIIERVRIDSSGNVGIGTTSPSSILDLNGAETMRGMSAPAVSPAGQGRIYFDLTLNRYRASQNGGAYADLVGSASAAGIVNDIQINKSGVFGVSDNPFSLQSAPGDLGVNHLRLGGYGPGWSNGSHISVVAPANYYASLSLYTSTGGQSSNDGGSLQLESNNLVLNARETTGNLILRSANSESMRIVSSGNVGIGTTSPEAKLSVAGAVTTPVSTFSGVFTCGTSSLDFSTSNFLRLSPSNTITAGSCAVTLSNLVQGGSYTLVITGNAATNAITYNFGGYTFKYLPANGATTATKDTIYTFLFDGTTVYVTWSGGY